MGIPFLVTEPDSSFGGAARCPSQEELRLGVRELGSSPRRHCALRHLVGQRLTLGPQRFDAGEVVVLGGNAVVRVAGEAAPFEEGPHVRDIGRWRTGAGRGWLGGRLTGCASHEHCNHHGKAEGAEPGACASAIPVLAHVPGNETGAAIVPWNHSRRPFVPAARGVPYVERDGKVAGGG
jgi:hypothetical protein